MKFQSSMGTRYLGATITTRRFPLSSHLVANRGGWNADPPTTAATVWANVTQWRGKQEDKTSDPSGCIQLQNRDSLSADVESGHRHDHYGQSTSTQH